MSAKSSIEWTDATWSPIRVRVKENAGEIARAKGYDSLVQVATKMQGHLGQHCEHVSPGCLHCYAESDNHRCRPYNGTGLPYDRRARDLVDCFLDHKMLSQPLHWRQPKRIFVENQSDLFAEWVPDAMIDQVVHVMAWARQHSYQILTKRHARLQEYSMRMATLTPQERAARIIGSSFGHPVHVEPQNNGGLEWPLSNVWLGVSVEDQATADERIPLLLQTPAAVRFVSYEPALWPVDFLALKNGCRELDCLTGWTVTRRHSGEVKDVKIPSELRGIDWVIIGGESGPGARPCDIANIRRVIAQCRAAGVAVFVKQLGACVQCEDFRDFPGDPRGWCDSADSTQRGPILRSRKGGDMNEWPKDIRMREWPAQRAAH